MSFENLRTVEWLLSLSFIIQLARISWIDIKSRIIPNTLIMLLFLTGVINLIAITVTGQNIWLLLLGVMVGMPFIPSWLKGQIGAGDIKLVMACGFFLGFLDGMWMLVLILMISMTLALLFLVRKKTLHVQIPFGPVIAASATALILIRTISSFTQVIGGLFPWI
jgi:leader peptidase (prepilin peptidase)/N-methyltransferase